MQLRIKITVARNRIRHRSLLYAKCKMQLLSVFRGCGRNGKNNIQATGEAIQLRLQGIRFLSD